MDGKIDLITLISLIVAVVVILKLRSVLGRRSSDDETRIERERIRIEEARRRAQQQGGSAQDKVVTVPRREQTPAGAPAQQSTVAEAAERIRNLPNLGPGAANGLMEILKLDQAFDPESFLKGARQAYEMIVTAFAEGNRKLLKDLLSKDVYDIFATSIADRESRGEQVDQSFVGISKAEIIEADVKNGIASVTIRFLSQLISATRDRAGGVVNGDPQKIKEITDVWTFSRDISSPRARANPNWKLIATQPA